VNEEIVAQGEMKTQPGKFTLSGDGLCIGRDSGDAVSEDYKTPERVAGSSGWRSRSKRHSIWTLRSWLPPRSLSTELIATVLRQQRAFYLPIARSKL
jgi:hypothetical protein